MVTPVYSGAAAPTAPGTVKVNTGGLLTTPVKGDAITRSAAGYTAAGMEGKGYDAQTGTSTGYGAMNWNVDRPQTVAGQIGDITESGSPLMQRAEARAKIGANKRGLLNSSMALQAGQSALYDAALPIAQADAHVNAQAANFNANAANTASQFTADAANKQAMMNQDTINRASEFGANAANQASAANQDSANRAGEFSANATNQASAGNQEALNRVLEQNAAAGNRLVEQSNQITSQAAQIDAETSNKMAMQNLDNLFKASITNADLASRSQLQILADQTKKDLASVEATYKQMIASNDKAGELYGKVMQNITDIVNNPDITATDKTTAIANQKTMLKTGMQVVSAVSGLDLGAILTF